jgi:L-ascorbate metabolism protein UlaG (beta-lactamase superfamily)
VKKLFVSLFLMMTWISMAHAAEPKLRWLGHAAFVFSSRMGNVFLIDPWITNPKAPKNVSFTHVEGILVTHGHFDHVGEAFELSKKFNAPLIASHELTEIAKKHGVTNVLPINQGGSQKIGDVTITAVTAVHSSSYKEGDTEIYAGAPLGFVVAEDGAPTFYHAGDTGVTYDMALVSELYHPAVALLPIGGVYTMKPEEAAIAARSLQVYSIIPMHYGTFPALTGTPEELTRELKRRGVPSRVVSMTPGQEVLLKDLVPMK